MERDFRAPQWEAKLSIKIIMAFDDLFSWGFRLASMVYPILYKEVLDREPVRYLTVLLYIFFF